MNKHLKKYLSILLLCVFTCNIVIVHKTHSMAIPAVSATLQQIPRILIATGACMLSFTTSIWRSMQSHTPPVPAVHVSSTTKVSASCQNRPQVLPVIFTKTNQQVHQTINTHNTATSTHVKGNNIANANMETNVETQPLTAEYVATQVTEQIADQEIKKLILNLGNRNTITRFTVPGINSENIVRRYFPCGVQFSTQDGSITLTIEASDRSEQNEARHKECIKSNDYNKMHELLQTDPAFRTRITQQLKYTTACLLQTQSPDFIMRLQARIAIKTLWIEAPLVNGLLVTIDNLDALFFHSDGTICRQALSHHSQANEAIKHWVDWVNKEVGYVIQRDQYINSQDYGQLCADCPSNIFVSFYRWLTGPAIGRHCTQNDQMPKQAKQFNRDMVKCLEYCKCYEFRQAEQLRDTYKSGALNDIIQYYKKVQIQQEHQKQQTIYDEHGIVRIAYSDPLYKQYKREIELAPGAQKKIVNQNFLVRYHFKNEMHEKWSIPQSAPTYVHDALYNIMGEDDTALSDISLLQERIEQVIDAAPETQRAQLIKAFYLHNGILKEYAQHHINVQTIKIPAALLDGTHVGIRQQLNTLIALRIKDPQKSAKINQAIECLQKSLNAKTAPERIKFKEQFDTIYYQLNEQPQQQKPAVTPQGDNQPHSCAPIPPDPDKDKKSKDKNYNLQPHAEQKILDTFQDQIPNENDMHHFFGKTKHKLDSFLNKYSNQKEAFSALYNTAKQKILSGEVEFFKEGKMDNLFEFIVEIDQAPITIRGRIINGVIYLATAFIRE